MFKTLNIYRLAQPFLNTAAEIDEALNATSFVSCAATQDKSVGWLPPRGEDNGALVETVAGQMILKLGIETKTVPGAVVRKKAQVEADHIEATAGRKPGKKETKALREDALLALLPQAFPKRCDVWVWIDRKNNLLFTDASSAAKNDEVVTALVRALDGLALSLVQTVTTPQAAMVQWLSDHSTETWPENFHVERQCELRSADEDKALVKFNRHHLLTDDVRKHISEGKLPTQLAMSYSGKVSFVLTEGLVLKKVALLDAVPDDSLDGFDADVALVTGELSLLVPALLEALGGESVPDLFGDVK